MKHQQYSPADRKFLAERTPQAQVIFEWALWCKSKGIKGVASRTATFRKDGAELVVFEYGSNFCAVLKKRVSPKWILSFKEWSQPFSEVLSKLAMSKWELVHAGGGEVSHAH